jgi:hypothetical protein
VDNEKQMDVTAHSLLLHIPQRTPTHHHFLSQTPESRLSFSSDPELHGNRALLTSCHYPLIIRNRNMLNEFHFQSLRYISCIYGHSRRGLMPYSAQMSCQHRISNHKAPRQVILHHVWYSLPLNAGYLTAIAPQARGCPGGPICKASWFYKHGRLWINNG